MTQENGHEKYVGSALSALTSYVTHPLAAVGRQITDRLGAFSAALGDASIPADYASKETVEGTSFRRHPVRATREVVKEFWGAIEFEADDEAWMVESHDSGTEVVVDTRSFLSRLAIGLGIETINDPPSK